MRAYSEDYLNDVVENQGKLFDLVAQSFPDKDTEDFIEFYMNSKTRSSIDKAQAYLNTMSASELWQYFMEKEEYILELKDDIQRLRYMVDAPLDDEFKIRIAREKLGMCFPDEIIFPSDILKNKKLEIYFVY